MSNFVEVRYSKDGGYTWSDWKQRSLGGTGDFLEPTIWRRWGMSRQWVVDIRMSNGVDLLAASIQAEEGGA